jgi:PAS domain-containing protein
MSTNEQIDSRYLIAGQSRMAGFIRAHDWKSTALGPIETWSETLLSQVNLVLCSLFPATLIWGPERIFLYNDATIPDIGAAHPAGLGCSLRRVFNDSWDTLSPIIDGCFLLGEMPMQQNVLIPMQRGGRTVDAFWTYFLIPVYEHGKIPGIRCVYQETTEFMLAKRERDVLAEHLSQILDATSDAIVSLSSDWRITYMNPRALRLFEAVGPVLGTICWESFPHQVYPGSLHRTLRACDVSAHRRRI